jgi:hypothetical protein
LPEQEAIKFSSAGNYYIKRKFEKKAHLVYRRANKAIYYNYCFLMIYCRGAAYLD